MRKLNNLYTSNSTHTEGLMEKVMAPASNHTEESLWSWNTWHKANTWAPPNTLAAHISIFHNTSIILLFLHTLLCLNMRPGWFKRPYKWLLLLVACMGFWCVCIPTRLITCNATQWWLKDTQSIPQTPVALHFIHISTKKIKNLSKLPQLAAKHSSCCMFCCK